MQAYDARKTKYSLQKEINQKTKKYVTQETAVKNTKKQCKFDIHGSVQRRWLSRNTNEMQVCNTVYYSKVYWRFNMFRAAHRSSSGALNCIFSLWFIYPCGDRTLSRLSGKWIHFPISLDNGRSPHGYINQRLQIKFRVPDDERCAARNMLNLQ